MSERRFNRRQFAAGILIAGAGALAISEKDQYTGKAADLLRHTIGDEATVWLEQHYFSTKDRIDQLRYNLFGHQTTPFTQSPEIKPTLTTPLIPTPTSQPVVILTEEQPSVVTPPIITQPDPMILPIVKQIQSRPNQGEGVWVADGLPATSAEDVLMAKTYIRPDTARPYSIVGSLLVDHRRARLELIGGTLHPGGDRGIRGSGTLPKTYYPDLLVAFNGGFQGPHGNYGMYGDNKVFRPLRNGLASVARTSSGEVQMGEWGKSIDWNDEFVLVRQNAVLLVEKGEITPAANNEGTNNNTWGYVNANSAEFITWRSALGLTKNGDILVAAGNSLSAKTLAIAMSSLGAETAMQLDINTPYVLTSLFFEQPNGSLIARKFMESMVDRNAARFLASGQERDFFAIIRDESKYK